MHQAESGWLHMEGMLLTIPFTWDFSMHPHVYYNTSKNINKSFNSLYLGFFHASNHVSRSRVLFSFFLSIPFTWDFSMHPVNFRTCARVRLITFQFPLLGIFPCIFNLKLSFPFFILTFNSLYLGFFHASDAFFGFVCQLRLFLYDLRYVFSIIIET